MEAFQQFIETYLIPLQLVFAMFGMGATLTGREFANVLRDGKGLGLGLLLQLVVVPLLTVGMLSTFSLDPGWAVGLVLVAVIPGGAYSNLYTFLGRGNTPLSVSVTLVSTTLSLVSVPLLLGLLAPMYLPDQFALPTARIIREIGLYLIVPLIAGMAWLRSSPLSARRLSVLCIRASVALVVVVFVSSLGSGRIKLTQYGFTPPLLITAYGTLLAVATPLLCRALGRYDDDTVALSAEVCVRNVGLGLLLCGYFFPGESAQGQVLFTMLYYGGMQMISGLPVPLMHRSGHSPIFFTSPRPRPTDAPGVEAKPQ